MIDDTFNSIPDIPGSRRLLGVAHHPQPLQQPHLILYENDDVIPSNLYVCNPARRRWMFVPPAAHHHDTIHAAKREKDRLGDQRGENEWESIKILPK
jgi:hypothetical protein